MTIIAFPVAADAVARRGPAARHAPRRPGAPVDGGEAISGGQAWRPVWAWRLLGRLLCLSSAALVIALASLLLLHTRAS